MTANPVRVSSVHAKARAIIAGELDRDGAVSPNLTAA